MRMLLRAQIPSKQKKGRIEATGYFAVLAGRDSRAAARIFQGAARDKDAREVVREAP
jgi:hypothetical protein